MRTAQLIAAFLPALVLADYGGYGADSAAWGGDTTTVHVTSTITGTVTNVVTATMIKHNSTSIKPLTTSVAHSNSTASISKPFVTFSTATTPASPVQVSANAAPRSVMDVALAGIAGAALYMVL